MLSWQRVTPVGGRGAPGVPRAWREEPGCDSPPGARVRLRAAAVGAGSGWTHDGAGGELPLRAVGAEDLGRGRGLVGPWLVVRELGWAPLSGV